MKWTSLGLVAVLSLVSFQSAFAQQNHYAYESCLLLEEKDAVRSNDCEQLNEPILKGDFAHMMVKVFALTVDSESPLLAEDIDDPFVEEAIRVLSTRGVINGENGDPTMSGAGKVLNRATAATLLYRALPELQRFPSNGTLSDLRGGEWYEATARKLIASGSMVGKRKGGLQIFAGDDLLTRGEAIALILQAYRAEKASKTWRNQGLSGTPPKETLLEYEALSVYENRRKFDFEPVVSDEERETGEEATLENLFESSDLVIQTLDVPQQVIPRGAQNVLMGAYQFTGVMTLKEITFVRRGAGNDLDLEELYLYYTDELTSGPIKNLTPYRITSGRRVKSQDQTLTFQLDLDLIGAGYFELRATISENAATGTEHSFRIIEIVTSDQVLDLETKTKQSQTAPITLTGSGVGTAIVKNNASLPGLVRRSLSVISRGEIQLSADDAAEFVSVTFTIRGSISAQELSNYQLYFEGEDHPFAVTAQAQSRDSVTLRVCMPDGKEDCEPYRIEKGATLIFSLVADLSKARYLDRIEVSLDEEQDLYLKSLTTGQGLQIDAREFGTSTQAG